MNEIQVRRCTGHCCNPVTLAVSPGTIKRKASRNDHEAQLSEMLIYLGWRSPAQGGWPDSGVFEYSCKHFKPNGSGGGECMIYGQGKRPWMCTSYPNGGKCDKPGCTRRTIPAIPPSCEATASPEVIDDESASVTENPPDTVYAAEAMDIAFKKAYQQISDKSSRDIVIDWLTYARALILGESPVYAKDVNHE